jgi:hypothetical protein
MTGREGKEGGKEGGAEAREGTDFLGRYELGECTVLLAAGWEGGVD